MQWSLIKTWAKEKGYSVSRTKNGDEDYPYDYSWQKIDDLSVSGTAKSLSKVTTIIYNHLTNNEFVEHQIKYQENLIKTDIDHNEISGQW